MEKVRVRVIHLQEQKTHFSNGYSFNGPLEPNRRPGEGSPVRDRGPGRVILPERPEVPSPSYKPCCLRDSRCADSRPHRRWSHKAYRHPRRRYRTRSCRRPTRNSEPWPRQPRPFRPRFSALPRCSCRNIQRPPFRTWRKRHLHRSCIWFPRILHRHRARFRRRRSPPC